MNDKTELPYIADFVHRGGRFTVNLPDGTTREVVVLAEFKGGSVTIDFATPDERFPAAQSILGLPLGSEVSPATTGEHHH